MQERKTAPSRSMTRVQSRCTRSAGKKNNNNTGLTGKAGGGQHLASGPKQVQKGRAESKQQESYNSEVTLTRRGRGSGNEEAGEPNQGNQPLDGRQQQEVWRGISR